MNDHCSIERIREFSEGCGGSSLSLVGNGNQLLDPIPGLRVK